MPNERPTEAGALDASEAQCEPGEVAMRQAGRAKRGGLFSFSPPFLPTRAETCMIAASAAALLLSPAVCDLERDVTPYSSSYRGLSCFSFNSAFRCSPLFFSLPQRKTKNAGSALWGSRRDTCAPPTPIARSGEPYFRLWKPFLCYVQVAAAAAVSPSPTHNHLVGPQAADSSPFSWRDEAFSASPKRRNFTGSRDVAETHRGTRCDGAPQ